MPDNKKTNAVKLTTVEKNKALMAKYKRERNNKTNTKSSKTNRNTLKTNKRNNTKTAATEFWKNNPNKKHSMKYGVNPNNPNKKFVEKTAYDGKGFGKDDKISKTFAMVAGSAVTGGLSNVAKAKGLVKTAKTIKTAGKIKKGNSVI